MSGAPLALSPSMSSGSACAPATPCAGSSAGGSGADGRAASVVNSANRHSHHSEVPRFGERKRGRSSCSRASCARSRSRYARPGCSPLTSTAAVRPALTSRQLLFASSTCSWNAYGPSAAAGAAAGGAPPPVPTRCSASELAVALRSTSSHSTGGAVDGRDGVAVGSAAGARVAAGDAFDDASVELASGVTGRTRPSAAGADAVLGHVVGSYAALRPADGGVCGECGLDGEKPSPPTWKPGRPTSMPAETPSVTAARSLSGDAGAGAAAGAGVSSSAAAGAKCGGASTPLAVSARAAQAVRPDDGRPSR